MERILGIDTGTNSLGWGIVENYENGKYKLIDYGVSIFEEGVKIEKGIEKSKTAERTEFRSSRKLIWRRKCRKINLLQILIDNHLCPPLTRDSLKRWRHKSIYPEDVNFLNWQLTDEKNGINPYRYRYTCLTQKLDMTDLTQRYMLGRAFYHIAQRRGFLSNRKSNTQSNDGVVNSGIDDLSRKITESGCRYLGEYLYKKYEKGEKIRKIYTSRNQHYLVEFRAICELQQLDCKLVEKLEKAIFYQRPLKSQKHLVGKCTFEPKKTRCSVSHPVYEEFRMYSFINNIKILTPDDLEPRPLSNSEKDLIKPLFYRKSKRFFPFEDIAKKLSSGKKDYCWIKSDENKSYKFNYPLDTQVAACPVTAHLISIFGENWYDAICEVYTLANNKTGDQIINDIWHVLFFFDDSDKLKKFAIKNLQLDEKQAEDFCKINMPQEYAAISLKAINNILPYMKVYGLTYSKAVFLGNLKAVMPKNIWGIKEMKEAAIEGLVDLLSSVGDDNQNRHCVEEKVKDYLHIRYNVNRETLKMLYHPSMIDVFQKQKADKDGIIQLGSPDVGSIRNPMAMRSLNVLRRVINKLLREGKIDEDTTIHIEFARELNDANKRAAISTYQKNINTETEKIREIIFDETGINATDNDILKYKLWIEQNKRCLYTAENIGLADFLGQMPKFDIEHTIPRSVGGDSTMMNLTLCQSAFNRDIKKAKLPSQLSNYDEILQRVSEWKVKSDELDSRIRKLKGSYASTKEEKDKIIRKRHLLCLERDYWRGKYSRFTMTTVPEGFSRRQGVGIGVISKYARLFLKSVFKHVFVVKGIATSDFRKLWNIQAEYAKKERNNHVHHCIDAITIACIGPNEYSKLAHYYHELEEYEWYNKPKPKFELPWDSFPKDMKNIQETLLVRHFTNDNMKSQPMRTIFTPEGKIKMRSDSARGPLHLDTFYGAINQGEGVKYVVRKSVDTLEKSDIKNVVDGVVREILQNAVEKYGNLQKAIESNDIWMNKEKQIPIRKVRLYAKITRPIDFGHHRNSSVHDYKKQYHVKGGNNYMMAIYFKLEKNKIKKTFSIISNFQAALHFRRSNSNRSDSLIPVKEDFQLMCCLKKGTMVILYENSPEEVWKLTKQQISNRLYIVAGVSSFITNNIEYGVIQLQHHQNAQPYSSVKFKNGAYKADEEFRAGITLLHTQFKALVEGEDFVLNEIGKIIRLK